MSWCIELECLDVTPEFITMQGLELLVHVDGYSGPQRDGWQALKDLAASSALTVTEEMPTSPYAQWTHVRSCPIMAKRWSASA